MTNCYHKTKIKDATTQTISRQFLTLAGFRAINATEVVFSWIKSFQIKVITLMIKSH